jgi:aryl carrier-like protein
MIPKRIDVVREFRLADSGKLDRTALRDQTRYAEYTTDDRAEERQLLGLVRQLVGTDDFGPADSLVAAGLGSVDAARLVGLARRSGLDVALSDVMQGRTVAGIVRLHRSQSYAFDSKEDS